MRALLSTSLLVGMIVAAAQAQNRPPILVAGPSLVESQAFIQDSVSFTVRASDPDGDALTYSWSYGDGSPSSEPSGSATTGHRYSEPGRYAVIVRVSDGEATASGSFLVAVHIRPLPGKPAASTPILFDSARGRVYCVNPDHNSFSAMDAAGLVRLFEAVTGSNPRSLAQAPDGTIWVANKGDAMVSLHDPGNGARMASIKLPYGSQPAGIAFSPDGSAVYVTLEGAGKLVRLDPVQRSISGWLELGPTPHALAVSADGKRILVTRFLSAPDEGMVYEVDGRSFTKVRTWSLAHEETVDSENSGSGVPNYLAAIAIASHGREALVVAKKDNTRRGKFRSGVGLSFENTVRAIVTRLDLERNEERPEDRNDIDNGSLPSSIQFSPMGDLFFVGLEGSNRFELRDLFNQGSMLEQNHQVGSAPLGMALDPGRKRLFVLNFLGRSVSAFDVAAVLANTKFTSTLLKEIPAVTTEVLPPEVLRGKRIFYHAADSAMSRDGYISCAACHLDGGSDSRVWDFTDRGEGLRRTTSLLGRGGMGHGPVHWSANFDEIQDFEHDMRGPFGGRGFMRDADFQSGTRNTTLGDRKAGLSPDLDALAAYVSSLNRVNPSPFRNADGSLTDPAREGEKIFNRTDVGCAQCHVAPRYTDSDLQPLDFTTGFKAMPGGFLLHDVGTLKPSSGQRLKDTLKGLDTPTLLGVWETGPYLHDGSAATLMDVITTANPGDKHGRTSQLSAMEKQQLVAFLAQLDQGPAPVGVASPEVKPLARAKLLILPGMSGATRLLLQGWPAVGKPRLTLWDGQGRLVKSFGERELRPAGRGEWSAVWNGSDRMGLGAAKGLYLVRAQAGQASASAILPWVP